MPRGNLQNAALEQANRIGYNLRYPAGVESTDSKNYFVWPITSRRKWCIIALVQHNRYHSFCTRSDSRVSFWLGSASSGSIIHMFSRLLLDTERQRFLTGRRSRSAASLHSYRAPQRLCPLIERSDRFAARD